MDKNAVCGVQSKEWMKIEYKGERAEKSCFEHMVPDGRANWVYPPSGTICVQVRNNCPDIYDYEDLFHTFSFIDLVNKVSFEIKLMYTDNGYKSIDSFYFCSENELAIFSASTENEFVRQCIYSVDYIKKSLTLQDTIVYKFTARDRGDLRRGSFGITSNQIVSFDGIEYIVLISLEMKKLLSNQQVIPYHTIYMIPKDPANRNISTKEFKLFLSRKHIYNIATKIREHFNTKTINAIQTKLHLKNYMVKGTKLMLYYRTEINGNDDFCTHGQIIGVHLEVDLMKLTDVSNKKLTEDTDIRKLIKEQENVSRIVVNTDNILISNEVLFVHCERDIGSIFVTDEKLIGEGYSVLLPPLEVSHTSEPSLLRYKIPKQRFYSCVENRFTLHPHGALLQLVIEPHGTVNIRVVRSLRMNLMSLALNRALFHNNTPIRSHPAYRLCFNRTKPIEYENNKEWKQLKRKLPQESSARKRRDL